MNIRTGGIPSLRGSACALGILGMVALFACSAPPPPPPPDNPPPVSRWGDAFRYSYDPPEQAAAASVPITLAVVNARYRLDESALKMDVYRKVAKGFSACMGVDLNRIIIGKGMTSRGPFADLEEITYKEKENSTLTLYPEVFLEARADYPESGGKLHQVNYRVQGRVAPRFEKKFVLRLSGWIAFNMEEPLTRQKMWIKKLNLEEATVTGRESYAVLPVYGTNADGQRVIVRHELGEIRYDGKVDALADYIKANYTTIMQKCWTYIEPDELKELRKQCEEIRQKAGFPIPK